MATYNRGHLIEETLESILKQSYENWECLIIDDGSSDNTPEIVDRYHLKTSRFKYFKRANSYKKGLPGCRNQGLELADSEYVIFFDDDDIVHPDNLKISLSNIKLYDVDYLRYSRAVFSGEFSDKFDRSPTFKTLLLDIHDLEKITTGKLPFNSCQILWKNKCFRKNKFNEDLMYAEEWECYSRILATGIKGVSIDKVLFYGRKHPNSNTAEFYNNDPVRRASKIEAIKLLVDNFSKKGLLTPYLVKYFIRLGFFLKDKSVLTFVLNRAKANTLVKCKYLWGFRMYPLLKPFFNLKAKLNNS